MIGNQIKTVVLLGALGGLLLLLGNLIGGQQGVQVAFVMALIINGIMYFLSDKIVLSLYKAQPLDEQAYPEIYHMVADLARDMQIPMPKLWLIKTPMANAFATGRNPKNASVALTTGIMKILDKNELRGVLAHELAHVKNRDILVTTMAATLATAIGYVAHMLQYAAFWGSFGSSDDRNKRGNPIVMILVAILMPIAATLLQLALSRSREYLADETGSHHSHDPLALASALEKLQNYVAHEHLDNDDTAKASTASLFIVNPFSGSGFINLFSTHPPMASRVARLKEIYKKMFSSYQ
jgi:heat shock protein HtpX